MTKIDFLKNLENGLCGLPKAEIEEQISFYSEMIDDRMEDGLSEEDAVAAVGSVEKIAEAIIADTPITKLVKEKVKCNRRISALEIVLLVLGSPIWISLGVSLFAVIISFYVALWAVVISFWASFVAVLACGFGGIVAGGVLISSKSVLSGLFLIGAALVCFGIAILLFLLCKLATKGVILFLNQIIKSLKNRIAKRSDCNV